MLAACIAALTLAATAGDISKAEKILERPNGTLRILSIGTGKGLEGTMFAARDAADFAAAIERGLGDKSGPFLGCSREILLDEEATLDRVLSVFDRVASQSLPQDTFVFFFAGNTNSRTPGEKEVGFHFLLHGVTRDSPAAEIAKKALSPSRLAASARRMQATRQLYLMDTEFPGTAFLETLMPLNNERADLASLLQRSTVFLGVENSREDPERQHGVLTIHVLESLAHPGDAAAQDGIFSARELLFTATSSLSSAENSRSPARRTLPLVFARGEDFPLAAVAKPVSTPAAAGSVPAEGRGVGVPAHEEAKETERSPPKRFALLVATNEYDHWPDLANPIPDARAIESELKDAYGFEVRLLQDPNMTDLVGALRDCAMRTYAPEDQLLLFVAGHGTYDEVFKEGYVIARDSRLDDAGGLTRLAHSNLRTVVENIPCEHTLLVLDVCYGGTFDQRIATGARGSGLYEDATREELLRRKAKLRTRLYLTSGGREYVPDGRPGEYSPFCRKFLEALRGYGGEDGVLTFAEILHRVDPVRPQPYYGEFGSNEPGSDFVFPVKSGR